jgi:hypothetical protein
MGVLSHPHFHPTLRLFFAMGLPAIADNHQTIQVKISCVIPNFTKTFPELQKTDYTTATQESATKVQNTCEPSVMMEGGEEFENSKAGNTEG